MRNQGYVVLYKKGLIKLLNFWKLSFDIFEKWASCDTCGRVDTKNIFYIYIFKKECRVTQTIDYTPNTSIIFIFWKGVSCDANGRLDKKTILWFLYFEKECMSRERSIRHQNNFYNFCILKGSVVRHDRSIRHQNYFYNFTILKRSVMRRKRLIRYQNNFYNFLL